jgi:D-lactate dehydrogenase (cytochrome)
MSLYEDLVSILSKDQVSTGASILAQHSRDESYHTPALPDVVVFAESTDDVVKVVRYAAEHDVPVVPFGTGTSLEGHAIPIRGGISLDMMRMNQILEVSPNDFLVKVQPGVTKNQLNDALRQYGLFFPVDPGSDASLGGMAATNASGTTTVRFGAMKDNVRSLQVVLADGTVIETGTLAAKSSSGYNLTPLFVGSEGTLGVITELWLRVYGLPEKVVAAKVIFPSIEACVQASTAMVGSGVPVARLEYVSPAYVQAFNKYKGTDFPVSPTLLVEFHGNSESIEYDVQFAQEIASEEGCTAFDFVVDETQRRELWEIRHNAVYAFMHQYPGYGHMSTDVCVPLSKLPDAIQHAQAMLEKMGIDGAIIGHVGDGNFHVSMAVQPDNPDSMAKANAFNEEVVNHALSLGGTCTGEHGVGLGKRKYQEREHGPALALMRSIKATLDPKGILNPGKLVHDEKVETHTK